MSCRAPEIVTVLGLPQNAVYFFTKVMPTFWPFTGGLSGHKNTKGRLMKDWQTTEIEAKASKYCKNMVLTLKNIG